MLGNMIGGRGYSSARDGLFGDQMANGGMGGAINRPQEMMAQMAKPKGNEFLSTVSPLGSMLLGQNPEGRNLPALLQMIGGLGGGKGGAGGHLQLPGLLGRLFGQ